MKTMANSGSGDLARKPTFSDLFTPKIVTVLREGYGAAGLKTDAIAGLTVAIVALPLSMAIAIGAGAKPENGLYTAVVGGFLISALGGSRFQIGGPAGAFIVLMATTIERFGLSGLFMATIMAGFLMLAAGYLRLGAYVKYIPHPVTVGFTAGIGVIIFASEIKDLFGLTVDHEPGPLVPKLAALWQAAPTINLWATGVTALCLALILGLKRWKPNVPGLLIAVTTAALLTFLFDLPVETIGSKFGGVPRSLPWPQWPDFPLSRIPELIPSAVAIAVLGSIESLLSAVVADGMTGRRHRSNCELVAQGYANIAAPFFGGLCATGTIARTATNVRAHAKGPVSGMLHAVFLLLFMLIAAPLATYIPLAALAAVLATVAWNMAERSQIALILRHDRGEAAVLLATFLLTIFRDLTEGIAVGVTLGAILFMHRMAQLVQVTSHQQWIEEDVADDVDPRPPYAPGEGDGDILAYRIAGPFFFGAASTVAGVLDEIGARPKAFVLDLSAVPMADGAGAQTLIGFATKATRAGAKVYIAGAAPQVADTLIACGLGTDLVTYAPDLAEARRLARSGISNSLSS
jgi:SulP family sulfate permease